MRAFCFLMIVSLALPALAQQVISITDYTGRGFAPDLVNYRIRLKPGEESKVRLADAAGQPVPVQVTKPGRDGYATLSFVAAVPPEGTAAYTVTRDGTGAPGASSMRFARKGGVFEIANALLAVRLPALEKTFKNPVPASTLPAPVLAFRSGGPEAKWLGSGKVLSERPVKGLSVELLASGPVFTRVQYEIAYAEGGYYRSTITVVDNVPVVSVTDEYDLGKIAPKPDLWELRLTDGWQPDMGETAQTWGNGGVRGSNTAPLKTVWMGKTIQPYGALSTEMSQIGLFNAQEAKDRPDGYTMAGIVPLHHGSWRRIETLPVAASDDRSSIAVQFSMTRFNTWSDANPFFAGTHEDKLPVTYCRRLWGLVLGKPALVVKANWGQDEVGPFYQARLLYGVIGLDRYKDYITDWPDTNADYPRVFLRKAELPKMHELLAQNPAYLDQFKGHYYFRDGKFFSWTGNPQDATASVNRTAQGLKSYLRYLVSCPTPSHHMTFEGFQLLPSIEDALSCPDLDPQARKLLRARLAVLAYEMVEPDAMGNGNGAHTGNPNMSIARQMWAADLIALLPDHPMYAKWRDFLSEYMEYKFGTMMTPGGSWFEPGGYQMWAYDRMVTAMSGMEVMKPANLDRLFEYHRAGMDYVLNQLTPVDPRFGARMHPGFGNSSPNYFSTYFDAASTFAYRDPDFAANLLWAWNVNGRFPLETSASVRPWITPKEPKLASRNFPGFGVIFRAHQGPDETYMYFRSGYDWSHWYVDQGNCVMFSKGAILLPYQPYAYYDANPYSDFSQYNLIRFGDPSAQFPYGWPDCNILDYAFGEKAQYAWMSAGYPAGQPQEEYQWNRQTAFLIGKTAKSPNYFVFHDTFAGKPVNHWLNFNLLGRKGDIGVKGQAIHVNTEFPVKLDLLFADAKPPVPEMAEDNPSNNFPPYSRSGMLWANLTKDRPVSPNWKRKDGKPVSTELNKDGYPVATPDYEQHVILRIPGTAADDHFWLAYPRAEGEAAPKVERLAANVVKITHAEGTDYLLLTPGYDKFEQDGITLEGSAAAVRVTPDGVTFALLGGVGRVGYKGTAFVGIAPFERTIALRDLKPGLTAMNSVGMFTPTLTGHTEVAPGVRKADDGHGTMEYLLNGRQPLSYANGDIRMEGLSASIVISPGKVRFIAPNATYVKLVAGARGIRGVGPFDITIDDNQLTGTVEGRARTLVASRPRAIHRPAYFQDTTRWVAGFEEERNNPTVEFNLAFGVSDGKHTVKITEWPSPSLPPTPATAEVK